MMTSTTSRFRLLLLAVALSACGSKSSEPPAATAAPVSKADCDALSAAVMKQESALRGQVITVAPGLSTPSDLAGLGVRVSRLEDELRAVPLSDASVTRLRDQRVASLHEFVALTAGLSGDAPADQRLAEKAKQLAVSVNTGGSMDTLYELKKICPK